MSSNKPVVCLLAGLLLMANAATLAAAEDLRTLFTTPQERQLINANRYKSDEVRPPPSVDEPEVEVSPIRQMVREEVNVDYRVSGISLSADGVHTAWINGKAYLDGEQLEDKSRIKVVAGDEVRVRITAPDGKHYFATSGETLSVTYVAAVEN